MLNCTLRNKDNPDQRVTIPLGISGARFQRFLDEIGIPNNLEESCVLKSLTDSHGFVYFPDLIYIEVNPYDLRYLTEAMEMEVSQ